MSESENQDINEFAELVHRVQDVDFLSELLSYMKGGVRPLAEGNDMKAHMVMFVRGRKHNKYIRKLISDRKKELNPHSLSSSSSSQHGGRRRTKRKSQRKNRKSRRQS
jgi:hypothetical protein